MGSGCNLAPVRSNARHLAVPAIRADVSLIPDTLTIAVLCRNEAKTIATVLEDARRAVPGARLLAIDNASTDGSGDRAREAGAQVVFVPEPGFGRAWRAVLASVETPWCVVTDGDGEWPLEPVLPRLIDEFERSGADFLLGKRISSTRPWYNARLGSPALSLLARRARGIPLSDLHAGVRLFRTAAIRDLPLRSRGMGAQTELVLRVHKAGLSLAEGPVAMAPAIPGRKSYLRPLRDGLACAALTLGGLEVLDLLATWRRS